MKNPAMKNCTLWLCAGLLLRSAAASADCPVVAQNQLGFLPAGPKLLALHLANSSPDSSRAFSLKNQQGEPILQGYSSTPRWWDLAGEKVSLLDLGALTTAGVYQLQLADCAPVTVRVQPDAYSALHDAAIKAYYFNRASVALSPQFAGPWARAAGHADDQVLIHAAAASTTRPAGGVLASAKGWYDAGDYNKYVVNSGVTTYTLLLAYSDFPVFYQHRRWQIPESANALPDLLDEVLWNLDWLRTMQDPADGGVYHKLTNLNFDGQIMPEAAGAPRFVVQKTTAAALNYAAVLAKASRVFAAFPAEKTRAADYAQSAKAAWRWALAHPDVVYQQPADVKTGAYGDSQLADEFAFAAAALYLQSGDTAYLQAFDAFLAKAGALKEAGWANPLALGVAELAFTDPAQGVLPAALRQQLRQQMRDLADLYLQQQQASPAALALQRADFVWGSNAVALNKAMVLLQAARGTADKHDISRRLYREAALGLLDYVLGRNPTGYSYVTGFGHKSPQHIHHRPSEADGISAPVPGWLAGGANPGQQDKCPYPSALPATSYSDAECSYASNEVAINWNAPLVYVLAAVLSAD